MDVTRVGFFQKALFVYTMVDTSYGFNISSLIHVKVLNVSLVIICKLLQSLGFPSKSRLTRGLEILAKHFNNFVKCFSLYM